NDPGRGCLVRGDDENVRRFTLDEDVDRFHRANRVDLLNERNAPKHLLEAATRDFMTLDEEHVQSWADGAIRRNGRRALERRPSFHAHPRCDRLCPPETAQVRWLPRSGLRRDLAESSLIVRIVAIAGLGPSMITVTT